MQEKNRKYLPFTEMSVTECKELRKEVLGYFRGQKVLFVRILKAGLSVTFAEVEDAEIAYAFGIKDNMYHLKSSDKDRAKAFWVKGRKSPEYDLEERSALAEALKIDLMSKIKSKSKFRYGKDFSRIIADKRKGRAKISGVVDAPAMLSFLGKFYFAEKTSRGKGSTIYVSGIKPLTIDRKKLTDKVFKLTQKLIIAKAKLRALE